MADAKSNRELEIFKEFARCAGFTGGTPPENRPPSEPDILFRTADGEHRAFELVELLDEWFARDQGLLFGTKTALRAHFESFDVEKKALFQAKYNNALLYFRFSRDSTFNRRRACLSRIFDRLLLLNDDFEGETLSNIPDFEGLLNGVSVSRGEFSGPIFDPESFGWIGDPTVPRVQKKFATKYETPYPVELLAYIDRNLMFPDEVWLGDLSDFLDAEERPLKFRRIWVFDVREKVIKFNYDGEDDCGARGP